MLRCYNDKKGNQMKTKYFVDLLSSVTHTNKEFFEKEMLYDEFDDGRGGLVWFIKEELYLSDFINVSSLKEVSDVSLQVWNFNKDEDDGNGFIVRIFLVEKITDWNDKHKFAPEKKKAKTRRKKNGKQPAIEVEEFDEDDEPYLQNKKKEWN